MENGKQIGRTENGENGELVDYFIFLLFSERRKNNFAFRFLFLILHFT